MQKMMKNKISFRSLLSSAPLLFFTAGIIVRLILLAVFTGSNGTDALMATDSYSYLGETRKIISGGFLQSLPGLYSNFPNSHILYNIFLYPFVRFFHDPIFFVASVQCLFFCLIVVIFSDKIFSGFWSKAFFCFVMLFYPMVLRFNIMILTESLFVTLLMGAVLLCVLGIRGNRFDYIIYAFFILFLCVLLRPATIGVVLIFATVVIVFLKNPKAATIALTAVVVSFYAAFVFPQHFIESKRASGSESSIVGTVLYKGYFWSKRGFSEEFFKKNRLSDFMYEFRQWDKRMKNKGLQPGLYISEFIKDHFGENLRLLYAKLKFFLTPKFLSTKSLTAGAGDFGPYVTSFEKKIYGLAMNSVGIFYAMVLGLAAIGLMMWRKIEDKPLYILSLLIIIYYCGIHTVTVPSRRHTLQFYPLMSVFATFGFLFFKYTFFPKLKSILRRP